MTPNCNRDCKSCIHYKRKPFNIFNECTLFRERDVVTGEIVYRSAAGCRRDETRCGIEGKYFKASSSYPFFSSTPPSRSYVLPLLIIIVNLMIRVFKRK